MRTNKEFIENVHLAYLEKTKEYKRFVTTLEAAFTHQWEDIATSGVLTKAIDEITRINKRVKKEEGDVTFSDAAFLTLIVSMVRDALKRLKDYDKVRTELVELLSKFSNEGGQRVLDIISDNTNTRPKVFNLTQETWTTALDERADGLLGALDDTTVDTISRQIKKLAQEDHTKAEALAALLAAGVLVAAYRAPIVAVTEGNAANEAMKLETARRNGIDSKEWMTAMDDRVCDICQPNNGVKVHIDAVFPSGHDTTPAHPRCRCSVEYFVDTSYIDLLAVLVTKGVTKAWKIDPASYYGQFHNKGRVFTITNPNALWVGGDGLVGSDKKVGVYAKEIRWTERIKHLMERSSSGDLLLDVMIEEGDVPGNKSEELLIEARTTLTDVGFLQLVTYLGFRGGIPTYKNRPLPDYPVRNYDEVDKRQAQDEVYGYADEKDNIDVTDLNYTVYEVPKGDFIDTGGTTIPVELVKFSKQTLKAERVVNIIDNFNEAQRKGGQGIEVYYSEQTGLYIIGGDGNHRLLAAILLGMGQIYASKIYVKVPK